jgi:hypothetical protein
MEDAMVEEKEVLLGEYYQLSTTMYDVLVHGKAEEFFALLEKRDEYIASINKLDAASGMRLKNERVENLLNDLLKIEQSIQIELQKTLGKLSQQVRFAQNEKFLTKQYEETIMVSKGVFYDEKK